jgi:hypothetical protein
MGPVTPDVAQQQNELKTARAQGLPFNIQNALQDVINLCPLEQLCIKLSPGQNMPATHGEHTLSASAEHPVVSYVAQKNS